MNAFSWLLRREVWEHRSFYLAPLVVAVLLVLLYSFGLYSHAPGGMVDVDINGVVSLQEFLDEEPRAEKAVKLAAGSLPFIMPTLLLNSVMLIVAFFYLVDTIASERKDRSVLFWKSLPVSDTATVLSKLVTAMVTIPIIIFALIIASALVMTLVNTAYIMVLDRSPMEYVWSQVPFVSGTAVLLYALFVQSLWYAPVFGWLLLASAWARRAPTLWAILPIVTVALLEGSIYRSSRFIQFIGERLKPVVPTAFRDDDIGPIINEIHFGDNDIVWSELIGRLIDPQSFITDPRLWGGLLVAGIFVAAAIWLRRYRDTV